MADNVGFLAKKMDSVEFSFRPREENLEAHSLARIAATRLLVGSASVPFWSLPFLKMDFFVWTLCLCGFSLIREGRVVKCLVCVFNESIYSLKKKNLLGYVWFNYSVSF